MTKDNVIIASLTILVFVVVSFMVYAAGKDIHHKSIDVHKCIEAGGKPTRHIEMFDSNYRGHLLCLHPSAVIDAE